MQGFQVSEEALGPRASEAAHLPASAPAALAFPAATVPAVVLAASVHQLPARLEGAADQAQITIGRSEEKPCEVTVTDDGLCGIYVPGFCAHGRTFVATLAGMGLSMLVRECSSPED